MPQTGKKERLFKPSVYEGKLKVAKEKGREQVQKRINLNKSRTKIGNIIKLLARKRALRKEGNTTAIKKFNEKYATYLGDFNDAKKAQALMVKLDRRLKIVVRSIENLRAQVKRNTDKLNQSKRRQAERKRAGK